MEDRLDHALKYAKELGGVKSAKPRVGFVYIIQCHDFVKVGVASNVAKRMYGLQTGCPYELRLLASWMSRHAIRDERRLHLKWRRYEVRGEWFQVPYGELVAAMNANTFEQVFEK